LTISRRSRPSNSPDHSRLSIRSIRYIPFSNHDGLNLYAYIYKYDFYGLIAGRYFCELQSFEIGKDFTYRLIEECSYDNIYISYLYNGHYILTTNDSKVVGGTTESSPNVFSFFDNSNYFPDIYSYSTITSQFFYALTSNIAISSNINFIDKSGNKHSLLKFNILSESILPTIKNNWKAISSKFICFYDTKTELLLTSDSINYSSNLKCNNLSIYYE